MKKYPFLSFIRKMLMSAFCRDSINFVEIQLIFPEIASLATPIFLFGLNSPCKDLLFPCGPNLVQKPLYLVSSRP